jgi:hypothetical protein
MDKKPYLPPRLTTLDVKDPAPVAPHSRRLYTRYDFVADAKVITSNEEISSQVKNISLGGCLLLMKIPLSVGTELTVMIDRDAEHLEATATVVHWSENRAGLMFGRFAGNSLFVLGKWVAEAKNKEQ